MSKIFRPHRGHSTAMSTTKKDIILEDGELFVECPDTVTDNNQYKIKIGNGVDTYENLKYALNPEAATQSISNEINDATTILGAKNLLPNGAKSATMNGIDFVVHEDGSVTANGTSTVAFAFDIFNENYPGFADIVRNNFLNRRLIVTGCPEGGSRDTYSMNLYRVGSVDGSDVTISERGYGYPFTWLNNLSGTMPSVRILLRENVTLNNLTFYPMIRLASIEDATYAPYAMTNKELTDKMPKVYIKEFYAASVTAGQDILVGDIYTITDGRVKSYLDCLNISLLNARGDLGYDTQTNIMIMTDGNVIVTPWATQTNVVFRVSFLYY